MVRTTTRVISNHRITLNEAVREAVGGLDEGDLVEVDVQPVLENVNE